MSGIKRYHYKKIGQWLPSMMAERDELTKKIEERDGKKAAQKKVEYPSNGNLTR